MPLIAQSSGQLLNAGWLKNSHHFPIYISDYPNVKHRCLILQLLSKCKFCLGFWLSTPFFSLSLSPGHLLEVHGFKADLLSVIWGWPKSVCGYFPNMLWKNPNELSGQPNPSVMSISPSPDFQMLSGDLNWAYTPLRALLMIACDQWPIANWVVHSKPSALPGLFPCNLSKTSFYRGKIKLKKTLKQQQQRNQWGLETRIWTQKIWLCSWE